MGWRRMIRRVAAWSVGPPLVLLAAVVGTTLALLYSPPGRALTARLATEYITARVAGRVEIGAIRGGLLRHLVLEGVTIEDSTGAPFLSAPRIEVRYSLPELLAGRIILSGLLLERPIIHLVRLREGRWNYQKIFRSGGEPGGAPPRVELRDVVIRSGTIRVDAPIARQPVKEPISARGAEPAQPEVAVTAEGLMRVYRATGVQAVLPHVRVSTPNDDPIRVVIERLAARLSDPAVEIVTARGELLTKADSLRFDLDLVQLPATRVSGSGAVRWPDDTVRYDFTMVADTVALADLRWIQPDFPDWSGRGQVTALSTSNRHTEFRLTDLVLGAGDTRAAGQVVAIVDEDRGFGVRDLDLLLRDVSLETLRPYLDTLPFAGALTGRLRADGYRSLLTLSGDLAFLDALPPGDPRSTFAFSGGVAFGGAAGATFRGFTLEQALVEMATVREQVPAVILPGRLRLVGRLDGPWQDAVFVGTAEHLAPNDALSRMTGTVRLDTRGEILGLAMDVRFDRLSFDALRTGYPDLTPRGGLTGDLVAGGRLDSLVIAANLAGDIGTVEAQGTMGVFEGGYTFDSMRLDVHRLDAEAVLGRGQATALNGRLAMHGTIDSAAPPVGHLTLDLGQSRIGGFTVDGVRGTIRSDGVLARFDSVVAGWATGRIVADGALGWVAPDSGSLAVDAAGFSLTNFDSLARATLPIERDTLSPRPLDGLARAQFTLHGSLERLGVEGLFEAEDLVLDAWQVGVFTARVDAESLSTTGGTVSIAADSVRHGDFLARDLALELEGTPDSLAFAGSGRLGQLATRLGGWRTVLGDSAARIGVDSLQLDFPTQRWRLLEPALAAVSARRIVLMDTVELRTTDGGGLVTLAGEIPGDGAGELVASVVGLNLADVYAVLERDTSAVGGLASADFRLGGTRESPTLRGNAMVTGPTFRDASPPLVRAAFDYRDQRLRSNLTFWKLGDPVLEVDVAVPYDLALAARDDRTLPGPIDIRAIADSADLAILEAFTTSVRSTRGWMALDLGVTGSWDDPRLVGTASVTDGRMTIPNLGVRYGPIIGSARFTGDSMVVDTLLLSSGEGDLVIEGVVRFEELSRAVLDLRLTSQRFLAMNVPGFMRLRPTGTVTLTGPLLQPVMRGNLVTITDSDVYFTDLITKDVIDLENPAYADLVDVEELRRQQLGAAFQNRFLDSLRIDNIRFVVGNDVWLRSTGATNIQLEGSVQVSKVNRDYRVAGELTTPRGDYQLQVGGIINRTFQIERGTVRYVGTPDLNAELDIQASHTVFAADGDEIPIVASITGTIEVPQVTLSSPGRTINERDLYSYLIFGRPEFQVASGSGGQGALAAQTIEAAAAVLSGEFGRTATQELGLDLFELRPRFSAGGLSPEGISLAAGVQLGSRWFVTLNAGLCLRGQEQQALSARNLGASIEYRFARDWRLQASAEPVQGCTSALSDALSTTTRRYQFGGDLLFSREY